MKPGSGLSVVAALGDVRATERFHLSVCQHVVDLMTEPQHPQPVVTLRDIAQALGVSHVTVSLALRDHPKVPPMRRKQIQSAAKSMGYSPNPVALALSLHKRNTQGTPAKAVLAWLNLWPKGDAWKRDAESLRYWQAAHAEAERTGYGLVEFAPASNVSKENFLDQLMDRDFGGLLIPPQPVAAGYWGSFPWPDFPAVQVGRSYAPLRVPFVTGDDINNSVRAFVHAEEHGYQRVGLILDSQSDQREALQAGFLHAQSVGRCVNPLPPLLLPDRTKSQCNPMVADWFRSHQPDAIIVEHQEQLRQLGTVAELQPETGVILLNVPKDGESTFAGIRRNLGEIARVAVQTLASQIQDQIMGFPTMMYRLVVEGTWINGASLPPRS